MKRLPLHLGRPIVLGRLLFVLLLLLGSGTFSHADSVFQQACAAYEHGDYTNSAKLFRDSLANRMASGTLRNLGSAEWQCGKPGLAILAWERSLWVDPLNAAVRSDLRFARKAAQLEAPDLTWYKVVSTWLPADWWGWIAGISFWTSIAAILLPGIFRWHKAAWHQVVAALGLTVFLLSLPAHAGIYSRSRIGIFVQDRTPLRLTPTGEAQVQSRVPAGEPARFIRRRGTYLLVQTPSGRGWVETNQFAFVCR